MARPSHKDRLATYQHEIERAKTWRRDNKYDSLWRRMNDLYAGDFMQTMPGEEATDKIRVNLAFSTVNTIVPTVALNYPKIGVVARRGEDEDRAVVNEQVLNYWWKHHGYHAQFREAVKDSVIYGFGWAKVGWLYEEEDQVVPEQELMAEFQQKMAEVEEAGQRQPELLGQLPSQEEVAQGLDRTKSVAVEDRPFVTRISPHDVYVSPEATSMNDVRWIAQRILTRKDELEKDDRYSAKARNEAQGGMSEHDHDDPRLTDPHRYKGDEWVVVWEFYDVERREMSVFADGTERFLLAPRPIPFSYGHPFQMLRNYDVPDKFYPMGDLEEIEDLILEQSMTRSQMMQWRLKYANKYLVRDGAIDAADYSKFTSRVDGVIIPVRDDNIELSDVVMPVPINQMDSRLFDWSGQIRSDINEVSGVSEIQRGIGGSTETATEASLIQDALNARGQERLSNVETFISAVARKLQQLAQQFLTGEQFVRVVGAENAALHVPYNRDDVSGEYDFEVEAGSTQPQNETYRRQQGIALMQTMMPFLEMGVVDPLKLAEHVLQDSFGVRNASAFMTPQAYQALQMAKQAEQQAKAQSQGGPPQQQGALGAPGNGQGLDAPQPTSADRADAGAQAQDAPAAF